VLLITALASQAADLTKAVSEAEGRKRAAENGLKEIKTRSASPPEQIRAAYKDAATSQNAWLETVCQAVEQGTATAPDVSTAAESAATTLVEWVSVRNRALGLPELTGAVADSVKKSVTRICSRSLGRLGRTTVEPTRRSGHPSPKHSRNVCVGECSRRFRSEKWKQALLS
jgi:flagellar hook-basal body complex protein FliE